MNTKITYSLIEDDALALNKYRAKNDPLLMKRIKRSRITLTISFAIVGIGSWMLLDSLLVLIWFLALSILSFFYYEYYYRWRLKLRIRETYKQPEYASVLTSNTLEASSQGLAQTSKLGQTTVDWDQIDDFFETSDHYFISVGQVVSIALPKTSTQIIEGEPGEFVSACRELKQQST